MTDIIVPIEGEICFAKSSDGNATCLILLNSVTRPKLIINNKNVMMIPPIRPP